MLLKTLINKLETPETIVLPDNFIKNILDKEDRVPERSRAGSYNQHVHVSSLAYNFCPRHYAIAIKENLALYESVTGGHKVMWKIGRAVEEHVRDTFIESYGARNVWAKWHCRDHKDTFREGFYKPETCHCGKLLDTYAEADIQDDENGVVGHADLIFRYKNTLFAKEIKSMNKAQWDELTEPLDTHIMQAGMYPKLLGKRLKNISPIVTFIYVTKDFKFGSPYKEFHVDMSEAKYVKMHDDMLAEAKQVKDFVQKGKSPERICASLASPLAKKCPVNFRCFNVYDDEIS